MDTSYLSGPLSLEAANRLLEKASVEVGGAVLRTLPVLSKLGLEPEDFVYAALPGVRKALMKGDVEDLVIYWKVASVNAYFKYARKTKLESTWETLPDRLVRDERPASMILRDIFRLASSEDLRLAEARYLNEYTLTELSEMFGMSFDSIRYRLQKMKEQVDFED